MCKKINCSRKIMNLKILYTMNSAKKILTIISIFLALLKIYSHFLLPKYFLFFASVTCFFVFVAFYGTVFSTIKHISVYNDTCKYSYIQKSMYILIPVNIVIYTNPCLYLFLLI